MKTQEIVDKIYLDFAKIYRGSSNFIDSGKLWDFCIMTIKNPVLMQNIVHANDLEIPPVKSLALIYQRQMNPAAGFEFNKKEKQNMGALMGFVFKFVLGYTDQKGGCRVNMFGIKTATRFINDSVTEVTVE